MRHSRTVSRIAPFQAGAAPKPPGLRLVAALTLLALGAPAAVAQEPGAAAPPAATSPAASPTTAPTAPAPAPAPAPAEENPAAAPGATATPDVIRPSLAPPLSAPTLETPPPATVGAGGTTPRLTAPDARPLPGTPSQPSATAPQAAPSSPSPAPTPAEAEGEGADAATIPHDLSPWGMFMAADLVVKSVMVGLAFASVVTWTIWLAKVLELLGAQLRARRALRCLEQATTLSEAVEAGRRWPKRGPVAALAAAALMEVSRSGGLGAEGVKERAAVALQRIEARAGRSMARGTGLLATIGSTAPFVGLFGTVWGIMNSFIGISRANTTNLAVVAPGIAEALLATAIGLVAAIPAVIIYNVFARSIAGYRAVLADASAEILRHLSRDLDRRAEPAEPARGLLHAAE